MSYRKQQTWKNSNPQTIGFTKHEKQIKVPFVIYAHFDALLVPPDHGKRFPKVVAVHKPCGFAYSIKCSYDDSLSKYRDFYGENCVETFWAMLEEEIRNIREKLQVRMQPQKLDKRAFAAAGECHFCGEHLGEDKIEEYSLLTGEFLGAAHQNCKYIKKVPFFVPVVMHNFSKNAAHYLLQVMDEKDLSFAIRDNENETAGTFISFSRKLGNMDVRFIDSSRFLMDLDLEELGEILGDANKHRVKAEFKRRGEFELMKTKGRFPHHHVTTLEQFSERNLPDRAGFYDKLHESEVSDGDYDWAMKVWSTFRCKTVGDYFRLYVKSNVFFLEDIFENFRLLCLDKYKLDPAQYYTVAGIGWDAMLKYTKVKLGILKDREMINFIKSNIRGGINQCAKRHAKANNQYCPDYNPKDKPNFIIYLDANNLAGWAMSQPLPFSEFSWLSKDEIKEVETRIRQQSISGDSDYGYILEVDLDYPVKLHELHNDLPFCCQRMVVPPPEVCPKFPSEKSVLNLYDKKNYVIDYRYLQTCLDFGLKLKKIHRVLKFRQTRWLEPYIAYNTKLRAEAKNDFEVKLYKLLNNSVYGKTIQRSSTDKPIYAGFCILELSKNLIYNFHYKEMLPRFKNRINLLYTDTDSLIYEIETEDLFDDFRRDKKLLELLDTSDMDPRWKISSDRNKKVVGKMKDECNGKLIYEFFGVGSKVYCLNVEDEVIKKAIGVSKYVKAKFITDEDYRDCIFNYKRITRKMLETEAVKHQLQTVEIVKTALSPGDTKRRVLGDKINTLAWGFRADANNK